MINRRGFIRGLIAAPAVVLADNLMPVRNIGRLLIPDFLAGAIGPVMHWHRFSGALTLVHNASSLILPSAANILAEPGDFALFHLDGVGIWRCLEFGQLEREPCLRVGEIFDRRYSLVIDKTETPRREKMGA